MSKNSALILALVVMLFASTRCFATSNDTVISSMHRTETESKMHDLMDTDHGKIYGLGQRDNYKNVAPLTDEEKSKPKEWHPQMHQHYHGPDDAPADDTAKE